MSWPLPGSWKRTADARVRAKAREGPRRRREANRALRAAKPVREREPVYEFKNNLFREKFYQILGHHYVLDLRDATTHPDTGRTYTTAQLILALGVSDTQQGRWLSEKTFVSADNFFAFQTLVIQKPLPELRLSATAVILERSVLSALHYLARTYDTPPRPRWRGRS